MKEVPYNVYSKGSLLKKYYYRFDCERIIKIHSTNEFAGYILLSSVLNPTLNASANIYKNDIVIFLCWHNICHYAADLS